MNTNAFGVVHKSWRMGFNGSTNDDFIPVTQMTPQERRKNLVYLKRRKDAQRHGTVFNDSIVHGYGKPYQGRGKVVPTSGLVDPFAVHWAERTNAKMRTAVNRGMNREPVSAPRARVLNEDAAHAGRRWTPWMPHEQKEIVRSAQREGIKREQQRAAQAKAAKQRPKVHKPNRTMRPPAPIRNVAQQMHSAVIKPKNPVMWVPHISGRQARIGGAVAGVGAVVGGLALGRQRKTDRNGVYRWNG